MSPRPDRLLLCFHHAGAGTSSFARWQAALGDSAEVVPVQLPGRGTRAREARITDPRELMADLEATIRPLVHGRPYLLYGHSLGGLVAWTFARTRAAAGMAAPELLAVGAVLPPHLHSPVLSGFTLPDQELLQLLVDYGALPQRAAEEQSIWRRRVLPTLRDDLRLGQALCAFDGPALEIPMLAVAGRRDPIAPMTGMVEWAEYAPGGFELRCVPGDHFFVREQGVAGLLREALTDPTPAPGLVHAPLGPVRPVPAHSLGQSGTGGPGRTLRVLARSARPARATRSARGEGGRG